MTNRTNATDGVRNIVFSAVILAGGKSSRMGQDKAFLEIGGQSLLARQIALVRKVGAKQVVVSGLAGVDYSTFGCRVVQDNFPETGPLAGIEAALSVVSSTLLLVLAVDMPAMNPAVLRKMIRNCTIDCGVIPKTKDGIEPLGGVYPKAALAKLKLELQRGRVPSVRWFAEECVQAGLAKFFDVAERDARCLSSVNSPEVYRSFVAEVL